MKDSFILIAGLVFIALIATLGSLGKLDGPTQRCIDAGKVWTGVKGAKCMERAPKVERRMKEGPTWTGN